MISKTIFFISLFLALFLLSSPVSAFGAGNIASVARIEGKNFRHGDIEDILKTLAFLKGGKWTNRMIRRVYFGNWLRDYSQALDVGTLKGVPASTIRILVWVLSLLSFGYATGEFEVTDERLGVYRPEEHIDNPKDYADNLDARRYDARLRPPVRPEELAIDPITCMKNYIANERLGIATSAGYIKYSLNQSIHYGRLYTSGPQGQVNNEVNLCEALRCLGQALHTLEDFSAHSNYVELVLREMGMLTVFPYVGLATEMILSNGKRVFPLVTGTFGGVDFLHSVLGEAQDKFTQSELEEMDVALGEAQQENKKSGSKHEQTSLLKDLLSNLPGGGTLAADADKIEAASDEQERRIAQPHEFGSKAAQATAGGFDPVQLSQQIMPILQFKDNVMHWLEDTIENIPGLSSLMETISDTLSVFVFSVLAPYIRPLIQQATQELKEGSSSVIASAGTHQFEVWDNSHSSDPTHSMLSKDHFSNILNPPAGLVAQEVVKYVVPRVLHCWENVSVDLNALFLDICQVLHHPGLRHPASQIQSIMFDTVARWAQTYPGGTAKLGNDLSSESVKAGRNHKGESSATCGHGKVCGGEWDKHEKKKKKDGKGDKKKKETEIKIGSVKVPTAGLNIPGVAGGFLSTAMAGLDVRGDEEEKVKKYKEKDKYKDDKDKKEKNKDKYYDDGYDLQGEKKKKEKEKKEKDKKDKKDKRDKYYGGRDEYEDDYQHDKHDKHDKYSHDKHDKKHRDSSPYKRSSSKDRSHYYREHSPRHEFERHHSPRREGHDDSHYHHQHSQRHEFERLHSPRREDHDDSHYHHQHSQRHEIERDNSPRREDYEYSDYHGGGGARHHHREEEYDYEYQIQRKHFSPPPQHTLGPYALPDPYRPPRSRSRSISQHRYSHHSSDSHNSTREENVDVVDVEVEFAVPIPVAPLPPPNLSPISPGYTYLDSRGYAVEAQYRGGENEELEEIGMPHYYEGDSAYFHKHY